MVELTDITNKRVDHLLLLSGNNPLPNLVSAPLLVNNGGRITIMYTTATEHSVKSYLAPALMQRLQQQELKVAVEPHDRLR